MSKQDKFTAALQGALDMGTKLAQRNESEQSNAVLQVRLEAQMQNGPTWDEFVQALDESFPVELGVAIHYDRHRAPRYHSAMGDAFLTPALVDIDQCLTILAYMGTEGIRYKVPTPAVRWDVDTGGWVINWASTADDVHENEYRTAPTGWTDNPYIAVKLAHEAAAYIPGLMVEARRRNMEGERPPRKTAAQVALEKADRHAAYSSDKGLVYTLLAIAHKMIDDN